MVNQLKVMFQVAPSSGVPIYRQIMEQVERMVASGHLKAGDELPSVRQAAAELEVNQMTISKAYSLLEAAGILERHRGKPMAIASRKRRSKSPGKRLELMGKALMEVVRQARQLDLPNEAVIDELKKLMEENNE